MLKLNTKKLFLLDMDGTIYLDNMLFAYVPDFLQYIRNIGGKYMFLTNNSSKSVEKYIDKLSNLGIIATEDDFLTSTDATVYYLKEKNYNKIYAFGTNSFKEQLLKNKLPITDKLIDDIDCLCMGFDTELTFQKLEDACILLNKDIDYIATNPDWVCPTYYGYVPDCGSIAQILETATKRKPKFIGKPQPDMVNLAIKKSGFTYDETVIIGDRLYTDIACGINSRISTIFVLSGEGTLENIETMNIKPEFIFKDIEEIYKTLTK